MKGKGWGSLTKSVPEGYRQVSAESGRPQGTPSGKMIPPVVGTEYQTNVVGSHGGSPSGKFLGQTGGNIRHGSKLMPERSSGVSTGHGGGKHKAGGK